MTQADQLDSVVDSVLATRGALVARIVERIRAEIPAYEHVPERVLAEGVEGDLRRLLAAVGEARPLDANELAASEEVGATRARQGVPVEALVHAFQIGVEESRNAIIYAARARGVPDGVLLRFVMSAWHEVDAVTTRQAAEHRRVELQLVREDEQRRNALLAGLLRGTLAAGELQAHATTLRLDLRVDYRALRARGTPEEIAEAASSIRRGIPTVGPAALVGEIDRDMAAVVPALPKLSGDILCAFGPPVPLSQAARSFAAATDALTVAAALGRRGLVDSQELTLHAAIARDELTGSILHERYVAPVEEVGGAEKLLETVALYLERGRHVEGVARQLDLHPNSVRKRLNRFSELTGCDLGETEELVGAWWALERRRLLIGTNRPDP